MWVVVAGYQTLRVGAREQVGEERFFVQALYFRSGNIRRQAVYGALQVVCWRCAACPSGPVSAGPTKRSGRLHESSFSSSVSTGCLTDSRVLFYPILRALRM